MKRKIILSSIMTIVLALSLIAGSTLALFTSQSQVNISVGSAKVSLLSVIDRNSLELYSLDVRQDTVFENGGTAEFVENAHLTLNNVTPGDKAVFNIVMTNDSTVDIQYRVAWSVKGALACGLVCKADGREINDSTSDWTEWKTPVSDSDKTRTVSVSVELPVEAGNEFQECAADITFSIVAVQGNGTELYLPTCDVLATPDTLNSILATAKEGTVIGLAKGKYDSITMTQNNLTLVSELAEVGYINLNAKDNIKLIGLTFYAEDAKMSYEMTSTSGVNKETGFYANIVGAENSAVAADNVLIQNCTFTGTPKDAEAYAPIVFAERNRNTESMKGFTVDGCTFETSAAYYIYARYLGKGDNVIINNTFGTPAGDGAVYPVYIGSGRSNVSVKGNTFFTWGDAAIFTSNHGTNTAPELITVCKNTFINTNDADSMIVLAYKPIAITDVVMLNNKANFGLYSIDEPVKSGNFMLVRMTGTERIKLAYDDTSLKQGGTLFLVDDIELAESGTIIDKDTKLLLNGYTISADRNYVAGAGLSSEEISTLCVTNGVTLEIEGDGSVLNTAVEGAYAVSIYEDSKVIIKGGNYISYHDAIYVNRGELYVEGGFFKAECLTTPEFTYPEPPNTPTMYLAGVINCYKQAYASGTAKVFVSGGTFVNEDITNLYEGYSQHCSFVVDGYTIVREDKSPTEAWFTVIPE